MQNKKIIAPVLALGILMGGAGVLATKNASAFFGKNDKMAENLASKLNVSKDSVSNALDQVHKESKAKMQQKHDAGLDRAVKDGAITEDQKAKLIEKNKEMRVKIEEQQKANQEEMDKWLADNGIDKKKIQSYLGGKGKMHHGHKSGGPKK